MSISKGFLSPRRWRTRAWVARGLSEPWHESVSLECAFSGYMTLTPPLGFLRAPH